MNKVEFKPEYSTADLRNTKNTSFTHGAETLKRRAKTLSQKANNPPVKSPDSKFKNKNQNSTRYEKNRKQDPHTLPDTREIHNNLTTRTGRLRC